MWIHGTSLRVQDPKACTARPHGWGMDLTGEFKKWTWVQFAVPTPAVASGHALRVTSAMIRFQTKHAHLRRIHVWDGDLRIAANDDLWLEGGMQVKQVPVSASRVGHGVAISVLVEFWEPLSKKQIDQILDQTPAEWPGKAKTLKQWRDWGTGLEGFVRFAAAGCEFEPAGFVEAVPLPLGPDMIDPQVSQPDG
jgi:hypothetical protein